MRRALSTALQSWISTEEGFCERELSSHCRQSVENRHPCPKFNISHSSFLNSKTTTNRISAFLDSVDVGDCYVTGELEAYSCEWKDKEIKRERENSDNNVVDALFPCSPSLSNNCTLNIFSGKLAGLDKKLSRSLDAEVATGCSPAELSKSPVGPLSDAGERRVFGFLRRSGFC